MVKKKEFVWSTFASFISAMLSAILLAFCTRLNSVEIAGMFSISFATASILNSIGDFGIRIYQVTDTNRKNSFSEYLVARIIAVLIMVVIGVLFVLVSEYRQEKLWICLLLILFRVIENVSETYQAEFQINGRLDLGGKTVVYRNVAGIVVFFILDYMFHNVVLAMIGLVIINLIILILYDFRIIDKFTKVDFKINTKEVGKLLKDCLPLAISTVISIYVINAVKYAIDASGDYTMQTYFNILYMPTFVINLISVFIIKPFLKPFGDYWNNKEYKKFLKVVCLIIGVLILAMVCLEIGCYVLGIPFLNLLYGVDLNQYKSDLLLLIVSGLFYAASNVLFYALGTMRKQKFTTINYILTAIFAMFVPNKLVNLYGMRGAVISSISIMGILFILMLIYFMYAYKKQSKE